jgi:pyridoxine 5-phosphate synthase
MTVIRLGVNIDHVATVRQARRGMVPSILAAASAATAGGADGITIHLREDRRHIQDADLALLAPRFHVNLEMAATGAMTRIALATEPERVSSAATGCRISPRTDPRPHSACLVPERREELTTEGGLDVVAGRDRIRDAVAALRDAGVHVSLFIEPDPRQIEAAREVGADFIELHTGRYAERFGTAEGDVELDRLVRGGDLASRLGLRVNAGHGLDLDNVGPILAIPGLEELNIGFSIVARALFIGLEAATREMKVRIRQ